MRPSRRLERWCLERLNDGPTVVEPPGLDRLTVVVPSFGRPEFILRQLVYWSGTAAHLLILDGSPDPIPESVREVVDARRELDYLHRPVGLQERLHEARDLIRTEYTVMGGDDEFLLRGGLADAVGILDREQMLVASMGQSLGFLPTPDGHRLGFGPGYPHRGFANFDEDPRCRLKVAFSDYSAVTSYSVMRTEVWLASWGGAIDWSSVYATEMQQAVTTWLSGGLVSIDGVYWLRSGENASVREVTGQLLHFADWWKGDGYRAEVALFMHHLADHGVSVGMADRDEASTVVKEALDGYVADWESSRRERADLRVAEVRNSGFRGRLIAALPPMLRRRLQIAYRQLPRRPRTGSYGGLVLLDSIADEGLVPPSDLTDELRDELLVVEQIVREFYRVR